MKWFEIELTGVCAVACPGCPRTRPSMQGKYYNKDMDMTTFRALIDMHDPTEYTLNFCGCYGDAIYHKHFFECIDYVRDAGFFFSISTAGANRPVSWWDELVTRDLSKSKWIWSIDGVKENNHLYRVNARWDTIEYGMRAIANMPEHLKPQIVEWKYIVFPYNEHTVEEARALASELNIKFDPVRSMRSPNIYNWIPEEQRKLYVAS